MYNRIESAIDKVSNSFKTVDYPHHEIHAGNHFFVKDAYDIEGSGTVKYLLFETPDSEKWIHILFEFISEAGFMIEIFEDATTSNDGTPISPVNNNRNSSNTANVLVFNAPTVTDSGTKLYKQKIGSANKTGGEYRGENEIILKQDSKILIKITKLAAGTHWFDINAVWYEHKNIS